jgi:hypothetical protein
VMPVGITDHFFYLGNELIVLHVCNHMNPPKNMPANKPTTPPATQTPIVGTKPMVVGEIQGSHHIPKQQFTPSTPSKPATPPPTKKP